MKVQTTLTHASHDEQFALVEKRARRFWVTFIVGFLSIQVFIGMGSVYLALGDPTVAVIPNYHQSALDWDVEHRAQERLLQLGWDVEASVSAMDSKNRVIGIRVLGGESRRPVENLHIEARVFHHARGSDIFRSQLDEIKPGFYATSTQLTRPGLWQIDLRLEGEHGIASKRIELEVD